MSDILPAGPGWFEHPTIGLEGRVGIKQLRGLGVACATSIRAMWQGGVR